MILEDRLFFVLKSSEKSAKGEYQIKLADGIILDRGGVSRVATMDFDNIQRLQIGLLADDEFWSKHPADSVQLDIGTPYFAKQKDRTTEVEIPNLSLTKQYSGLWIKHDALRPIDLRINNLKYNISYQGDGLAFFALPSSGNNQTLTITMSGEEAKSPLIFTTSNHKIDDLSNEILSDLNYPAIKKEDSTAYGAQVSSSKNKIVILSLLYDQQWQSNSGLHIPVYGFLNGYLLTGGEQSIYLKNHVLHDIIYNLFAIFLIAWALILVFLGYTFKCMPVYKARDFEDRF